MSTSAIVDTNFGLAVIAAAELQSGICRSDRALRAFGIERMSDQWSFKFAMADDFSDEPATGSFLVSGQSINQWEVLIQASRDQARIPKPPAEWANKIRGRYRDSLKAVRRLAAEEPIVLPLAVQRTLEAMPRQQIGETLLLQIDVRNQAASLRFLHSHIDVSLSVEQRRERQYLSWWCWYCGAGVTAYFPADLALATVEKHIAPVVMRAKGIHGRAAALDSAPQTR